MQFSEKYSRAIDEVKSRHDEILARIATPAKQKSYKGRPSYVCPVCGHGKGGDGVTFNDEGLWHCFTCQTSGDVLKWYQLQTRCNGFYDALRGCCEVLGLKTITDDSGASGGVTEALSPTTKTPTAWERLQARVKWERKNAHYKTIGAATTDEEKSALVKERTDYLARCAQRLADADDPNGAPGREYLRKRGFGDAGLWTLVGLGYDPATGRLTIPYNAIYTDLPSFTARKVGFKADGSAVSDKDSGALKYLDGGSKYLFLCPNVYDLPEARRIYVCEGALDAVSVWYALGLDAMVIALNGVDNRQQFLDFVEHYRNNGGHDGVSIAKGAEFVLMLDNDEAGHRAAKQLADGLAKLGCMGRDISGIWGEDGDANKHCRRLAATAHIPMSGLVGEFGAEIHKALEAAPLFMPAVAPQSNPVAQGVTAVRVLQSERLNGFMEYIQVRRAALSTGLYNFDTILHGGLRESIYAIGAMTGFGKTSFVLQVADFIAQQGRDVFIVSMEMSARELWAKSVSRMTFELALAEENAGTPSMQEALADARMRAVTTTQIMYDYPALAPSSKALVDSAISKYQSYADHIMVQEGMGVLTAQTICDEATKLTQERGVAPVIVVDYLQILQPTDSRADDRRSINAAMMLLKRLSRDLHTPVLVISSFNRQNYRASAEFEAFKESGGIEYSCDLVIGLQYKGMEIEEESNGDRNVKVYKNAPEETVRLIQAQQRNHAEEGRPKEIQLKILKNRHGRQGSCFFDFYSWFGLFMPVDPEVLLPAMADDEGDDAVKQPIKRSVKQNHSH